MEIDLNHIMYLSKISIEPENQEKFKKEFSQILSFVDEITKLSLDENLESEGVGLDELRQDEIQDKKRFDALKNAPEKVDGCYKVPLVVE